MPRSDSVSAAFFLANMFIMLGIGGRLLLAARRTRRAAEAAVGTSAAFGALAVILGLIATSLLARNPSAFPLWAASRWAQAAGLCGLAVGSWRIYHPDRPEAAAAAAISCATALTAAALRTLGGSMPPPNATSTGLLLSLVASLAVYGWATVEAFRYHRVLRRRLALGLADPVVTHQFLLWGYSGTCALATTVTGSVCLFAFGTSLSAHPGLFAVAQLALLEAAVALWFAFFPPRFYRGLLRRRATRAAS